MERTRATADAHPLGLRPVAFSQPAFRFQSCNPPGVGSSGRDIGSSTAARRNHWLTTSADGDPLSCNARTYLDPDIATVSAGNGAMQAGGAIRGTPWSQLPQELLDQPVFPSATSRRPPPIKVVALNGYTTNNEMLISLLAAQLAPKRTVQGANHASPRQASEGIVDRASKRSSGRHACSVVGTTDRSGRRCAAARPDEPAERIHQGEHTCQAAAIDRYVQSQSQVRRIRKPPIDPTDSDDSVGRSARSSDTHPITVWWTIQSPGGDNHSDGGLT
jgi:hypothetical protein